MSLHACVVAMALAACGTGPSRAPATVQTQTQPAKPASAPPVSPARKPAPPDPHSIAEMFDVDHPTLVGPFAKLRFGLPIAEAKAAVPELFAKGSPDKIDARYGNAIATIPDAWFMVSLDDGDRVHVLTVSLPPTTTEDLLARHWGPPTAVSRAWNRPAPIWRDPATRLLVRFGRPDYSDKPEISFWAYRPLDEVLAGLEKPPIYGARLDDLQRRFGAELIPWRGFQLKQNEYTHKLLLPGTECDLPLTTVDLRVDGGKVRYYRHTFAYDGCADRATILQRLEARFGPSKTGSDTVGDYLLFSEQPRVVARDRFGRELLVIIGDHP